MAVCAVCKGTNKIYEPGDAHRSPGWVPCPAIGCVNGRFGEDGNHHFGAGEPSTAHCVVCGQTYAKRTPECPGPTVVKSRRLKRRPRRKRSLLDRQLRGVRAAWEDYKAGKLRKKRGKKRRSKR